MNINELFIIRKKIALSALFFLMVIMSCSKSDNTGGTMNTGNTGGNTGTNAVIIQGFAFSPASLTVPVNTTVTWTNKDVSAHTVTSDTGLFDSGSISTNGTFTHKFTSTGTFNYHCTIHPAMTAKIIVQ